MFREYQILCVIYIKSMMADLFHNPKLILRCVFGKLVFVAGCQGLSLSVSVIPLLILNEAIESRIYGILARIFGILVYRNDIL